MAHDKDAWVKEMLGLHLTSAGSAGHKPAEGHGVATSAAAKHPAMASVAPAHDTAAPGHDNAAPGHDNAATVGSAAKPPVAGAVDRIASLPINPVDVLKLALDVHACHVNITNNTDLTLVLDPSSVAPESGKYKGKHPKKHLKPDDDTDFEVDSKSLVGLSVGAVEGTVRYISETPKVVFTCHYKNPRLLSNDADAHADPSGTYSTTANADSGDDAAFTFTFEGGSGGGGGGDQPSSGVAASCRVSVVNQTQQTVFLRKQDKAAGDYVTNPASSLAPGAKTDFVFAETPNSKDHGCRGLMTWEVGDPKQAKWDLMFDNVKGGKNLTASFLDPKDGGLHSLDQIDEGDENVPVTFTLSGAGGGGQQPTGKPLTCVLVVNNHSSLPITLLSATPDDGSFQSQPPTTIAVDASATIKMTGPADTTKPASGSMAWTIGSGQAGEPKAAVWTFTWTNPPGAGNAVSGLVAGDVNGLISQEEVGDGDQDVACTFTLIGQVEPVPTPSAEPTSCAILVTNSTQSVLTLSGQQATQGEFKKAPPKTIAAGASAMMTFTGAKDAPDKGASGTMTWTLGDPQVTTWSLSWNNPPGDGNTAIADFTPSVTGLSSDASCQPKGDDDVPFTFILTSAAPTPVQSTETSCAIMVTNSTQSVLTLSGQQATQGEFKKGPPQTIAAGVSALMTFAGTKDAPDKGASGTMTWTLGDPLITTWSLSWNNPPGDGNTAIADFTPSVTGLSSDASCQPKGDDDVPFTFVLAGAPPPPVQATKTSCLITVKNETQAALTLTGQKADSGSFTSAPPGSIAAGQSAQMEFDGPADDAKHAGAAGSMTWQIGDDTASTCVMDWKNPPGDGNAANATVASSDTGLKASAVAGKGDENVPFTFDITGKSGPGPGPDDTFDAPPKSKQPTLRKGDDSPDGWIEYAQTLLTKAKFGVPVTGKFDAAMQKAVEDFQRANGCQVDGTIGNETWSVLRGAGQKDAVGVDGRKPHSFEETGAQARFFTENNEFATYSSKADHFTFILVSPGEQKIDDFSITAKVSQKDGTSHTHKMKIGSHSNPSPDGQGNAYRVEIDNFKALFQLGSSDPADCTIDAYLDSEIGGDRWTGQVTVV